MGSIECKRMNLSTTSSYAIKSVKPSLTDIRLFKISSNVSFNIRGLTNTSIADQDTFKLYSLVGISLHKAD